MSFYSNAEVRVPNKSVFNLKHRNVTSFKFDKLYPTLCDETLAGDELRLGVQSLSRFAPMVSPVFGSIKMYNHFFYVPNRLVQPFWKNFWSEDQTPTRRKLRWKTYHNNYCLALETYEKSGGSVVPATASLTNLVNWQWNIPHSGVPVYSKDTSIFAEQSLADYLGIPTLGLCEGTSEVLDLTPFLAYQFVYNEYYRDSELEDDLFETPYRHLWWFTAEGCEEFLRCLQGIGSHDFSKLSYFVTNDSGIIALTTTALNPEYVQDGLLPLTSYSRQATLLNNSNFEYELFEEIIHDLFQLRTRAWHKDYFTCARPDIVNSEVPIVPVQFNDLLQPVSGGAQSRSIAPGQVFVASSSTPSATTTSPTAGTISRTNSGQYLFTKLGFTISALRLANAIQKKEEKIMMFGKRYLEQLASRFGVISSDASLQRPQYLGGTQSEAYCNEISQTSETSTDSAQGNYSGQMIVSGKHDTLPDFFCEEHGFIFCITSFLSETAYAQGLEKKFTRRYAEDFYTPEFATLSDQQVLQKELDAVSFDEIRYRNIVNTALSLGRSIPVNNDVFGYQGRWDEYRQKLNRFSGQMREETSYWHFGRHFPTIKERVRSAVLDTGSTAAIGVNFMANGDIVVNFTGTQDISSETSPYKVPVSWLRPDVLESLYQASLLDDFMNGSNVHVIITIPVAEWQSVAITALDYVNDYVFPRSVALLPSFIHSSVPTRGFTITNDQKAFMNQAGQYLASDDYIFTDMFFTYTAVRAMPERSMPKI